MQDAETVAQILAAEGIADYPQDLRQLSAAELRPHQRHPGGQKPGVAGVHRDPRRQAGPDCQQPAQLLVHRRQAGALPPGAPGGGPSLNGRFPIRQ